MFRDLIMLLFQLPSYRRRNTYMFLLSESIFAFLVFLVLIFPDFCAVFPTPDLIVLNISYLISANIVIYLFYILEFVITQTFIISNWVL